MYTVLKDEMDAVALSVGGYGIPLPLPLGLQSDRVGMPGVTELTSCTR